MPLGITLGDPAGIGPEIVARYLADRRVDGPGPDRPRVLVFGSREVFERSWAAVGAPYPVPDARPGQGGEAVGLVDPGVGPAALPRWGIASREAGAASHAWVLAAADAALAGHVAAVVTAPIHKGAWHEAGVPDPGHTEALARRAGGPRPLMLLVGGSLRVALATIHVPLKAVPGLLGSRGIVDTLSILARELPAFPGTTGRPIAVCGLNPHAGEGGLLGHEDLDIVAPAVEAARRMGLDVVGPLPADACIPHAIQGRYDAVLAMYHDQGLVAVKSIAPRDAVNVTLGLPFVRTSVDHGTAFDIAGRGIATASSLEAAIELATVLAAYRRAPQDGGLAGGKKTREHDA